MARRHTISLRVTETGYIPDDDAARAQHKKFKVGTVVGAEIARSRSLQQHRLYWEILTKAIYHQRERPDGREWRTPEALHEALKVATGRTELLRLVDGRLVKVPQSTSFAAMGQDEFQAFFDEAKKVIEDEVVGMSIDEMLTESTDPATNAAEDIMRFGSFGG